MSHDTLPTESLVSRRRALGAGLFLLAGAMVGLGAGSALAQSRGQGRSGGGSPNGDGGSGSDVILAGAPGNCIAGTACGTPPTHRVPEQPQRPRRRRWGRTAGCDVHRLDDDIDHGCRDPE